VEKEDETTREQDRDDTGAARGIGRRSPKPMSGKGRGWRSVTSTLTAPNNRRGRLRSAHGVSDPSHVPVTAPIEISEPMGSESIVYFKAATGNLIARVSW